jgi:glycosyltransferase involved in cell wall biosynthesis
MAPSSPRSLRLLQVTGTLEPAYGGPPVVVNQLTTVLGKRGHHVDVVTLDDPFSPWLSSVPGTPVALGCRMKGYRFNSSLKTWLGMHASEYDAVIVHGIWQYQSKAVRDVCRRLRIPYFLFVHGALDPWFEQHYPGKHLKKTVYWKLFEYRVLRDAQAVLFTCEEERRLARTSFAPYRAAEAIVGLGIDDPPPEAEPQRAAFLAAFPHLRDKRIVLFLSRLHPKKGCDLLIRAFADACRLDPDLHLVIAGPDADGTRADLESLAGDLGVVERLTFTGMVTSDTKWGAYRCADVFALTSHSENFGIVIAEALACGLPALITDKVNIWREIDSAAAGFVDTDTNAGASRLLARWLALEDQDRARMRERARQCFLDNFEAQRAGENCLETIAAAIGKVEAA